MGVVVVRLVIDVGAHLYAKGARYRRTSRNRRDEHKTPSHPMNMLGMVRYAFAKMNSIRDDFRLQSLATPRTMQIESIQT
jgi:hypothetical protein